MLSSATVRAWISYSRQRPSFKRRKRQGELIITFASWRCRAEPWLKADPKPYALRSTEALIKSVQGIVFQVHASQQGRGLRQRRLIAEIQTQNVLAPSSSFKNPNQESKCLRKGCWNHGPGAAPSYPADSSSESEDSTCAEAEGSSGS